MSLNRTKVDPSHGGIRYRIAVQYRVAADKCHGGRAQDRLAQLARAKPRHPALFANPHWQTTRIFILSFSLPLSLLRGNCMALTATVQSTLPPNPSWDETIVPALRKRTCRDYPALSTGR